MKFNLGDARVEIKAARKKRKVQAAFNSIVKRHFEEFKKMDSYEVKLIIRELGLPEGYYINALQVIANEEYEVGLESHVDKKKTKFVKAIIYGGPGVGKTTLAASAPSPFIIDTDKGTQSIDDMDIPSTEVGDFDDLENAAIQLQKKKWKHIETVIIDDATEVAEVVLQKLKKEYKDGRQAYYALGEEVMRLLRIFRDIDKHVIFVCKKKILMSDGVGMHMASMPGTALVEKIPYMVGQVLALRIDEDEGYRYVQTQPSYNWDAKDRSNTLDDQEEPDMSKIIKKILNGKKKKRK